MSDEKCRRCNDDVEMGHVMGSTKITKSNGYDYFCSEDCLMKWINDSSKGWAGL